MTPCQEMGLILDLLPEVNGVDNFLKSSILNSFPRCNISCGNPKYDELEICKRFRIYLTYLDTPNSDY
jgi:hypothetical protein